MWFVDCSHTGDRLRSWSVHVNSQSFQNGRAMNCFNNDGDDEARGIENGDLALSSYIPSGVESMSETSVTSEKLCVAGERITINHKAVLHLTINN